MPGLRRLSPTLPAKKMVKYTEEQIVKLIFETFKDAQIYILAPLVKRPQRTLQRTFWGKTRKKGFLNVRVDGEIREIVYGMKVDRYKTHHIEMVVDKLTLNDDQLKRLKRICSRRHLQHGKGIILIIDKNTGQTPAIIPGQLMCSHTLPREISYNETCPALRFRSNRRPAAASGCLSKMQRSWRNSWNCRR